MEPSEPSPTTGGIHRIDRTAMLVLVVPAVIFALYVIVKIVAALGADDY